MTLSEDLAKIVELATSLERDLTTPDTRDGLTVLERIRESFQGWPPGSGFDRTSRRATDDDGEPLPNYSDPTGSAGTRPDKARDDLRQMEKDVRMILGGLDRLTVNGERYQLRSANVLERKDTAPQAGCVSCARVPGPSGAPYWSPVYRTTTLANGTQADLCQWCLTYVRRTGDLPPKQHVEDHRDGKRVRLTA